MAILISDNADNEDFRINNITKDKRSISNHKSIKESEKNLENSKYLKFNY